MVSESIWVRSSFFYMSEINYYYYIKTLWWIWYESYREGEKERKRGWHIERERERDIEWEREIVWKTDRETKRVTEREI